MQINYLQKLRDNPYSNPYNTNDLFKVRGISETEIVLLEQTWNSGNPFPKVLKELLFLAGEFCICFSYGPNDTQNDYQLWIRGHMAYMSRVISRPFYALHYYGGIDFLFIYLDEGDNPMIYQASPYVDEVDWIKNLNINVKDYIGASIDRIKRGENPY